MNSHFWGSWTSNFLCLKIGRKHTCTVWGGCEPPWGNTNFTGIWGGSHSSSPCCPAPEPTYIIFYRTATTPPPLQCECHPLVVQCCDNSMSFSCSFSKHMRAYYVPATTPSNGDTKINTSPCPQVLQFKGRLARMAQVLVTGGSTEEGWQIQVWRVLKEVGDEVMVDWGPDTNSELRPRGEGGRGWI